MTRKTATTPGPARRSSLLAPPREREPGIGAGTAAAIYFALALVYFLPALLPGRMIFGTDLINSGYFYYNFISQRFAAGVLPRWVPYVYGGVPLFSNPGSTYYPVRFLADWLFPVKDMIPLLFLAQFFAAGWGMYLLARELGARPWVAFVGGLAFQWTGLLASWVYAGHDGRVIVGSLIPLLFFFLHRGVRTGRVAPFAGVAATVGFAVLSFQVQVAWYMLVGGAIWAIFALSYHGFADRRKAGKVVALGVAAVVFGFAMNAVNLIPFSSYVAASPRAGTGPGYAYSTSYSMAPANVVAMAVPEQIGLSVVDPNTGTPAFPVYHGANGIKLHSEYVGATVLVLLVLGCFYARRDRYFLLFAGMGVFFLTMALGGNTPLYHLYWAILPGIRKFRAPDLAYTMVAFCAAAMAVLALEAIARARDAAAERRPAVDAKEPLARVPWIGGAVVALAVLGAAALGGHPGNPGEPSAAPGWMRFAVFAAAVTVALWLWTSRRIGPVAAMAVLAVLTTADLWIIGKKFFYTIPGPEVRYALDDVAAYLQGQPKPFRVWSVRGESAWPQDVNYPMLFGIDQAGGEHGNQLQRYNEFVGWRPEGGSTPTFENFNDPRFRAADNVRYVVISQEVQGLKEVLRSPASQALVYEDPAALGRAQLVGEAIRAPADQTLATLRSPRWDPTRNAVVESPRDLALAGPNLRGSARVTRDEPDRVEVATQADGAALLVLADNFYPGWKAAVDGRPAEIYRTNHTFRGVVVPAGAHRVEFTFNPAGLVEGFWIYLATLALLAAYGVWLLVGWWRSRDETSVAAGPAPAAA